MTMLVLYRGAVIVSRRAMDDDAGIVQGGRNRITPCHG